MIEESFVWLVPAPHWALVVNRSPKSRIELVLTGILAASSPLQRAALSLKLELCT